VRVGAGVGSPGRCGAGGGGQRQPDIGAIEGLHADAAPDLGQAQHVDGRQRGGRRGGGARWALRSRQGYRQAEEHGAGQHVVEQVEACEPCHYEDEGDPAGGDVHGLAQEHDPKRRRAGLVPRAERPQYLGGGDEEDDRERQGRCERPPGRALEEGVEPLALSAGVQVGGKRREHQVDRGEEEQDELRDPSGRGVGVEPPARGVVRQDEQVAPEERLRQQRGRRPRRSVPQHRCDLGPRGRPGLGPLRQPPPHDPGDDQPAEPREVVGGDGRIGAPSGGDRHRGEHDPGHRLADPEHPQRRRHPLQSTGRAQVDVRGRDQRQRRCADRDRLPP